MSGGEHVENVAKKVIYDKLQISEGADIVQAQRFGSRPKNQQQSDNRPILIEVKNIEAKRKLVSEVLQKKPSGFYISELLSENMNTLFYRLRKIKRDTKKIQVLYTKDGIIKARKTTVG